MNKDKKILYFGNDASLNYIIVKNFRNKTNYNIDLLLQDYNSIYDHPAWHDIPIQIQQTLVRSNPQKAKKIIESKINEFHWQKPFWIKENPIRYSIFDKFITKYVNDSHIIKKQIHHYIKDISHYDLVITDGFGAITANKANIPYIVRPIGSDIDILPFENNYRGKMIKKTLSDANYFFVSHDSANLNKLEKIKQTPISVVIDIDKIIPSTRNTSSTTTFFLIARLDFGLKGTDKVMKAFAKLIKKYDAKLFYIAYGSDVIKTQQLVKSLNLIDYISIYDSVMSKPVLYELFGKCDAVIGDLGSGHIGISELEAMAANKPVIANNQKITSLEKDMPILDASSEEEIYLNLEQICQKKELPQGMREFVRKHFGFDNYKSKFDYALNEIFSNQKKNNFILSLLWF